MNDLLEFSKLFNFKGLDLDNGKRDVDLMKDFQTADDLGKEYGYDVALPVLGGLSVNQYAAKNAKNMIPEGKEIINIKGKNFVTDADRPKDFARIRAGIMDKINMLNPFVEATDLDKLGGLYEKDDKGRVAYNLAGGLTQFDPKDLSQLQLSPSQQRIAGQRYKEEIAGMGSPTDTLNNAINEMLKGKNKLDTSERKKRLADVALESLVMRANMPFVTNTLKDISTFKQQQLLDAEAIKQGMPNAVQARLLVGDQGFATQAAAIANQADAATRMAAVGVNPRNVAFGMR